MCLLACDWGEVILGRCDWSPDEQTVMIVSSSSVLGDLELSSASTHQSVEDLLERCRLPLLVSLNATQQTVLMLIQPLTDTHTTNGIGPSTDTIADVTNTAFHAPCELQTNHYQRRVGVSNARRHARHAGLNSQARY